MKRLFLILLMLVLVAPVQSQTGGFWGLFKNSEIEWGKAFKYNLTDTTSDSTGLVRTVTYADSTDTLYTDMLPNAENEDGVFNIFVNWDSLGFTDSTGYDTEKDSLKLQIRAFVGSNQTYRWMPWRDIGNYHKQDTTVCYEYELADSTWNRPCRGWQFRSFPVDADFDSTGWWSAPQLSIFKY